MKMELRMNDFSFNRNSDIGSTPGTHHSICQSLIYWKMFKKNIPVICVALVENPPKTDNYQPMTGGVFSVGWHGTPSSQKDQEEEKFYAFNISKYLKENPIANYVFQPTNAVREQFFDENNVGYRDGTTHVLFEPLDFIARLAALVPKPRVNLTRFHGVFGPNSRHRVTITPALRNKTKQALQTGQEKTRAQKHQSMTWAQRLKRVFGIEIETCEQCGGAVKVIASIDKSAGKPICTANAARKG
jgi:hypothetical protein